MSKLFFDHLVDFEELEGEIREIAKSSEEKEELWQIVDETIHHRTLTFVLDKLPKKNHEEFLNKFYLAPFDTDLIIYLKEKIGENLEEILRQEIGNLAFEILQDIKSSKNK